ncbi:class I poly(R)-hydroxyalkanoic acid synthase [Cupriavidus metallidurans]|uniref:class I poly(R)-hydroxyalkanoic acid synthase n=1 Tax=Cupriavidus metallidurans TaxID=119219 RepID=UPI001BFCBD33|nr:class I poly(R)-hydroxyalkanoic acid synthase [Cupriavidus metallidurans]QWC90000.1 class I poly(R)-hydroxyalkanoic acid synthase [Cupriavidus metallidurans]
MPVPTPHANPLLSGFPSPLTTLAELFAYPRYLPSSIDMPRLMQSGLRHLEGQFSILASAFGQAGADQKPDRRFAVKDWDENPWYRMLKEGYLLNAKTLAELAESIHLDDDDDKSKLSFFLGQLVDAMSPSNFLATNPEAIRLALETNGESLLNGFANYVEDMRQRRIAITDESAFEVGRDVATSEGAVVFECDVMQLIQYKPLTSKVMSRPLVIVPPCINKYYILDLQPENSFVRFACEQGYTVFVTSWRNPQEDMRGTTWDDYVEGVIKALEVTRAIGGASQVNALGWCVGGTLLTSALAVQEARGEDMVASMTLLTTMLDFTDPGDLGFFLDEATVVAREQSIGNGGIYSGKELAFVFQTLRPNDLIWPYVVTNYLKGKSPAAFDLLYWNADATNLPGPMYAWYLRNMYLENRLCKRDELSMCGHSIDLSKIKVPSYILATKEDHIVPWQSAYRSTQLLGGDSEFVLGESGHIAGVINPASKQKRGYWSAGAQGDHAEDWLASAQSTPGSWWTHWSAWLKRHGGKQKAAPANLGDSRFQPIEPAPGRYVKVRVE